MRKALLLTLVFVTVGGALAAGQQADPGLTVPGQYIVVFRDTVADVPGMANQLVKTHGGTPLFVYQHAIKGFAADLPEQAVEALKRNPNVAYVEPDSVVWAFDAQQSATWGLDRIDQRNLPLSGTYNYDATGYGVTAYVIDTGIYFAHNEFAGRAISGWDFIDNDPDASDCNGHGTHVAGTIGGLIYGVAKDVDLVAVRVLNCSGSGSTSGVIAGIDWVTADHQNKRNTAVANMSLGGGASTSLDTAVRNSIASGVSYAIAAGNGNLFGIAQNACNYSPSRVAEAMTVSATDRTDAKASWANYGDCVDWFAPGVSITSAWYTNTTATNTISGTSMATPHTAGVAALYLQTHLSATPQQVRDALYAATTKGIVTNSRTTNNHLLYSLVGSTTPNVPPAASFTYTTSGLTVSFTDTSTDSDGSVDGWSWNFGDGGTSAEPNPSHTYGAAGSYSVTLTVTDNNGASGTSTQNVSVTSPISGITLTATGYKVKGLQKVDLRWSGTAANQIEIWRNGTKINTVSGTSFYTDSINKKGGGTYTYKVCEAGGTVCSNEVTVVF